MKYIESETIELKEKLTDDVKKEIIAFANSSGGIIYIGINDIGEIVGVKGADKVMESVSSMIHNSIKPDLTMLIAISKVKENNLDVVVIKIGKGINKPYYLTQKGLKPSGVFIRCGVTSIPSSEEMIRKMILESNKYAFEEEDSFDQNLTFDYASRYFENHSISFSFENKKTLGIVSKEGKYTNLGLIFSDQSPYLIKFATYKGETPLEFNTRKEFGGAILKIVDDVFNYFDLINEKNSKIIGYERIDNLDYPQYALREAFLNAIVHRDYSYKGGIIVDLFSNRIEIKSLGGITSGLTMEDILQGVSETRNPRLANIFYRLSLIETYGTGIGRINSSYENYQQKPEFKDTSNTFTVVLYNTNYVKNMNSEKQKIIEYLKKHGTITRAEVENILDVKKSTALNYLNDLIKAEKVVLDDATKKAKYTLK